MKRLVLVLVLGFTLSSCDKFGVLSPPTPETPRQGIALASTTYTTAGRAALTYIQLPRCQETGGPTVCSSPAVVSQIQRASAVARQSLDQATDIAIDPKSTEDMKSTALTAATNAVKLFQVLAEKYKL